MAHVVTLPLAVVARRALTVSDQAHNMMQRSSSLYAAIDLGSNSFHMLVVREVAGTIQILDRIKQKVRLAAGLDTQNHLSQQAMERGWRCLTLFSERLQDIPPHQIRVVATATLRFAANANQFLQHATDILGCPIQVISGEEEAELIYHGVAQTTGGSKKRLVVDIGGGSTELITGNGAQADILISLPMGCVTWLKRYFSDRKLTNDNFARAEQAAQAMIKPAAAGFRQHGWQVCVGASGTVQALQEIMVAQGMDERITLEKLQQLKQNAIRYGKLEALEIAGLTSERALVFPSGLSILIAIFQELDIDSMILAGGALREGLVYDMLHLPVEQDIRNRTLHNLQQRYLLDTDQAQRVNHLAENFLLQVKKDWPLDNRCHELLQYACLIHEIGLSVDFKHAPQHAAYLIRHGDLPGFTPAQKLLLSALLQNQSGRFDVSLLRQQNALPLSMAQGLCRLLRLAIIFCNHRRNDAALTVKLQAKHDTLSVRLPPGWMQKHAYRAQALEQECRWQNDVSWPLVLIDPT